MRILKINLDLVPGIQVLRAFCTPSFAFLRSVLIKELERSPDSFQVYFRTSVMQFVMLLARPSLCVERWLGHMNLI